VASASGRPRANSACLPLRALCQAVCGFAGMHLLFYWGGGGGVAGTAERWKTLVLFAAKVSGGGGNLGGGGKATSNVTAASAWGGQSARLASCRLPGVSRLLLLHLRFSSTCAA